MDVDASDLVLLFMDWDGVTILIFDDVKLDGFRVEHQQFFAFDNVNGGPAMFLTFVILRSNFIDFWDDANTDFSVCFKRTRNGAKVFNADGMGNDLRFERGIVKCGWRDVDWFVITAIEKLPEMFVYDQLICFRIDGNEEINWCGGFLRDHSFNLGDGRTSINLLGFLAMHAEEFGIEDGIGLNIEVFNVIFAHST